MRHFKISKRDYRDSAAPKGGAPIQLMCPPNDCWKPHCGTTASTQASHYHFAANQIVALLVMHSEEGIGQHTNIISHNVLTSVRTVRLIVIMQSLGSAHPLSLPHAPYCSSTPKPPFILVLTLAGSQNEPSLRRGASQWRVW